MANDKSFMKPGGSRRGGSATEQRLSARVATTDGAPNAAGYGRGSYVGYDAAQDQAAKKSAESPYSHEGKNYKDIPVENSEKIVVDFQPNILDHYDAVTYHWKLFIVSPGAAATGEIFTNSNQVIIAESGVSDLTIDKVELRGVAVPSLETGTGTQTMIKFEIVEPSGAGLMDKIFYESVSLGIGNWLVMPLYLQLEFRARTPDTSNSVTDGAPSAIGNMRWVWPIKMTGTKANVTTVGTRYEFEAVTYNEYAQSNTNFSIQHNVTLTSIDTFGNAMEELQKKLNQDQYLKLIDNYSIPNQYRIIVDPELKNELITPIDNKTNSIRNNAFTTFSEKSATFSATTGIDKIIDTLLATTRKYQEELLGASTPGAEGLPLQAETNSMKKFWRIVTETRPIGFDKRRQDNAIEIVIYVIPYNIGILDSNTFQNAQPPVTDVASFKRFRTYVKNNILKKKYNYIFTGLNDQIVSFDLNLNFAFASAVSRYGGIYLNAQMADKGVVTQDNSETERQVTEKLRKALSFIFDPQSTSFRTGYQSIVDAEEAIKNSDLSPDLKSRYTEILSHAKAPDKLVNATIQSGGLNNDGSLNASSRLAKSLAQPLGENIPAFVSDVDLNSTATADAYKEFLQDTQGKIRPIAHIEQVHEKSVGQGIEANSNSGISKLATMFSVALHSSLDANLQSIKIVIKGDPFWIFPGLVDNSRNSVYISTTMADSVALDYLKNYHNLVPSSANYYGTDNFMVLRFRTPRIYNLETNNGDMDPYTQVETFSGIYKVTMVTSRFEMGKFVQELECILDPVINISDISQYIEEDARNPQIVVLEQSGTNLVPVTAQKTDKLSVTLPAPPGIVNTVRDQAGQAVNLGKAAVGNADRALSNIPAASNLTPDEIIIRRKIEFTKSRTSS